MSDNNKSDLLPEEEKKPEEDGFELDKNTSAMAQENDDDILELSEDITLSDDDDDIIELTEEALPIDQADEVLELSEEAGDQDATEALTLEVDDDSSGTEDILELEEAASGLEEEDTLELVDEAPLSKNEAPLTLELTEEEDLDTSEMSLSEPSEDEQPAEDEWGLSLDIDEPIDEKEAGSHTPDDIDLPKGLELGEALDEAIENEPAIQDDLADAEGISLDAAENLSEEPEKIEQPLQDITRAQAAASVDISTDQIEAALERIIERKLSEKIDDLLIQAIENAVTKEIDRIKRLLMDEISED